MTNGIAAFVALAEPTRLAIVERLARRPMAVGQLASQLPVTRPAVSQHLKVLKQARLVTDEARGTRRIYRLDPRGMGEVREWLDRHWESALASFAEAAEREEKA